MALPASFVLLVLTLTSGGPTAAVDGPRHAQWRAFVSSGQGGLHRFEYAGLVRGEPVFRENGVGPARTAVEWINAETGARPGVSFFDTADGRDPQAGNDAAGSLTPPIHLTCRRGALLVRGFAYFNATRVTGRCPRRRGVDLDAREGSSGPPRPRAHVAGVIYNEGDLVLRSGFTVIGAVRAGGTHDVRQRATVIEHPSVAVPPRRRQFPPPDWRADAPVPTGWPMTPRP